MQWSGDNHHTTTTVLRPFVWDFPGESVRAGQAILDFAEADMMGWQWHQLRSPGQRVIQQL